MNASAVTVPRIFLVVAGLPLAILAILALLGAREGVDVVMTGAGSRALLGAAWVATWLATVIVSPIAAFAALLSFTLQRAPQSRSGAPNGKYARNGRPPSTAWANDGRARSRAR